MYVHRSYVIKMLIIFNYNLQVFTLKLKRLKEQKSVNIMPNKNKCLMNI